MTEKEIYTGNYGFDLVFDTKEDLSNSLSLRLRIRNPKGANRDIPLTEENIELPKEEGKVSYSVKRGDFTVPGIYRLQVFDETGGVKKSLTDVIKYKVRASLDFIET